MKNKNLDDKRMKRGTAAKAILRHLVNTGRVTAASLLERATSAVSALGNVRKYHLAGYLKTTLEKLRKKGLVEYVQDGEFGYVYLTPKGEVAIVEYEARHYDLGKKPKRWDGKWRLVIFDIPETLRLSRNTLRGTLINLGFVKVQNSVWAYPYDCEEFVFLLKTNFELGKKVLYLVVDKMENDKWLRRGFGLP